MNLSFRTADILDLLPDEESHWVGKILFWISSDRMYADSVISSINNDEMKLEDGEYLKYKNYVYYGQDENYVYFSNIDIVGRVCYVRDSEQGGDDLFGKILSINNGIVEFPGDDEESLSQLFKNGAIYVDLSDPREVRFS